MQRRAASVRTGHRRSLGLASAYIGNCLMPPLFGVIANHTTIAIFPYYLLVILILMGYMHEALQKKTKAAQ